MATNKEVIATERVARVNQVLLDRGHDADCLHSGETPDTQGFRDCTGLCCETTWRGKWTYEGLVSVRDGIVTRRSSHLTVQELDNLCTTAAEQFNLLPEMISGTMTYPTFKNVFASSYGEDYDLPCQWVLETVMPVAFDYARNHYGPDKPPAACNCCWQIVHEL